MDQRIQVFENHLFGPRNPSLIGVGSCLYNFLPSWVNSIFLTFRFGQCDFVFLVYEASKVLAVASELVCQWTILIIYGKYYQVYWSIGSGGWWVAAGCQCSMSDQRLGSCLMMTIDQSQIYWLFHSLNTINTFFSSLQKVYFKVFLNC